MTYVPCNKIKNKELEFYQIFLPYKRVRPFSRSFARITDAPSHNWENALKNAPKLIKKDVAGALFDLYYKGENWYLSDNITTT